MEHHMERILEVKNLYYGYEKHHMILQDITLCINKGEKIAVLGANGAGKSTFFLNLNGVLQPQKGEIIYRGEVRNSKNMNIFRKNIGIVFQDADNQMIAATVKAEVSFGPMNLKLSKEEVKDRVERSLEYMNLSDMADRPPHYLSGGEKKRVSIADIIAMESEIIIFDEPTAALDPINTIMLETVLERLGNEQKTCIISTHDVDFAYRFADRIIIFCDGKIIADGKPMEVFENDGVLEQSNLKRPMLLEVVKILKATGKFHCFEESHNYPKSIEAFREIAGNMSE